MLHLGDLEERSDNHRRRTSMPIGGGRHGCAIDHWNSPSFSGSEIGRLIHSNRMTHSLLPKPGLYFPS